MSTSRISQSFRLACLIVFAAMVTLLTACGGGSSSSTSTGQSQQAGNSSNLTLAVPDDAPTVDPAFAGSPRGTEIVMNAYDPMATYALKSGPDGVRVANLAKIVGLSLASITPNDDFSEWTLKLRPGLKFPNGAPVTIEDVRYTFARSVDNKGTPGQFMDTVIGQVPDLKSVKITGKDTIKLTLRGPNQMLPRVLALTNGGIVQKSVVEAHATKSDPYANAWLTRHTAGSGAYVLKSWQPGQQIVLAANPAYAGNPKPTFKQVTYRIIPSGANRVALLRRGAVDIATGLTSDDVEGLKGADGVKVVSVPNAYQLMLVMNNKTAPFNNKLIRQAISYAVPSQQIIDQVYKGLAKGTAGPVPTGFPGHDAKGYPYAQQNLKKAKELLAKAGKPNGFTVGLQINAGSPDDEKTAIILQAALDQIGVKVNISKVTPSVFEERRRSFSLGFYLTQSGWDVADPSYALTMGYACKSFLNFSQYCNANVDSEVQRATSQSDPGQRTAMFNKIQQQVSADAPVVWIAQPNTTFAMRDTIAGYADFGDLRIRFKYLHKS
jgi:peptide/nickel transport system substrate-binding protein